MSLLNDKIARDLDERFLEHLKDTLAYGYIRLVHIEGSRSAVLEHHVEEGHDGKYWRVYVAARPNPRSPRQCTLHVRYKDPDEAQRAFSKAVRHLVYYSPVRALDGRRLP